MNPEISIPTKIRLKKKETVASGTMAFYFEKPVGLQYTAGQYIHLTLDRMETDALGNTRCLTLASAPFEKDLMVATRMRESAFKKALGALEIGAKVTIDRPAGNFVLPTGDLRPLVFLAGGIGITPFRSMILQATHERRASRIDLFYSNRTLSDAAFLEELAAQQNSKFKLIATMTEDDSFWRGEKGRLDKAMLQKYLKDDFQEAVYSIAGPALFVSAFNELLLSAKVDKNSIRTEYFPGY